jgi:hypothetical protein
MVMAISPTYTAAKSSYANARRYLRPFGKLRSSTARDQMRQKDQPEASFSAHISVGQANICAAPKGIRMHIVEIRCPGRELGAIMSKMRSWLDHHRAVPSLFELAFLPAREIRFQLTFQNAAAASEFAHVFGGEVLSTQNRPADLAA